MLYLQSSNFLFSVFGREKDRFSFIVLKVNAELVVHKPVTYIGVVLIDFFFYWLWIPLWNPCTSHAEDLFLESGLLPS